MCAALSSSYLNEKLSARVRSEHRTIFYYLLVMNVISISLIIVLNFGNFENHLYYINWVLNFYAGFAVFIGVWVSLKKIFKGSEAKTYASLTIGLIFFFLGEITWTYYQSQFNIDIPYPSLADLFWLIGYIFFIFHIYGTFSFWRYSKKIVNKYIIITSTIISIIAAFMIYIIMPQPNIGPQDALPTTISILYIILDSVMVIPAIAIVAGLRTKDPFFTHWLLMSFFIIFLFSADFGFSYSYTISEEVAANLEWIWDIMFNAAYIFVAIAIVWYQRLVKITYDNIVEATEKGEKSFANMWDKIEPGTTGTGISNSGSSRSGNGIHFQGSENIFTMQPDSPIEMSHCLDKLCQNTHSEILIWYNTNTTIDQILHKNFLEILDSISHINTVKVRILFDKEEKVHIDKPKFPKIEYLYSNQVAKFNNIFFVSDNKYILLVEIDDIKEGKFSCLYSNNEQMVLSYLSIFESNWNLSILREQKV